ncbi:MAG: hypothetical protein JSW05_10010 [Candidatus Thorarchaeota archaeon]|nr:MAG: hypothetical protein JSW05_10010 [Candidatus Thorarchaeota archaeon]
MSGGCTLGAKIVGNRYFLLKNRDLVYKDFRDTVVFDDTIFGVTGVKIGTGEPAGVSIGFNKWGLSACNSTVLATSNKAYDVLMERVLREAKSLDRAYELVTDDLQSGSCYQWGNFLLATHEQVCAIEIGDGVCEIERSPMMITRANHHLRLPTMEALKKATDEEREAGGPIPTSQRRRQLVSRMLEDATSLGDMMKILSSHSETRGFDSICRHRKTTPDESPFLGETSYSYIVEVLKMGPDKFDFRIHAARGTPCSNKYDETVVDFSSSPAERFATIRGFP